MVINIIEHNKQLQLPDLSSEQLPVDSDVIPNVIGYASHWTCLHNGAFLYSNNLIITTISASIVTVTKLSLLGFCYEILQFIRKHKINRKTNEWYYYYWGAQVLMIINLLAVIYFEGTKQRNKTALYLFITSIVIDIILITVAFLVIYRKIFVALKQCIRKNNNGTDTQGPLLSSHIINVVTTDHEHPTESPTSDRREAYDIELDVCYKQNSTQLSRLTGKLWQPSRKKEMATKGVEFVPPPLTLLFECCDYECCKNWQTHWTIFTNIISLLIFLAFISYLSQAFPAIVISYYLSPTASLIRLGFIEVIIVVMLFEIAYILFLLDKLAWLCYYRKRAKIPNEIKPDHDEMSENNNNMTFIDQYIDSKEQELICSHLCKCTNGCCHCCFILIIVQIVAMVIIAVLSGVILYFLLNVVIQQTSGSDDQFKDILAIVPTIALNLWLVFRQGDFCKAVENIANKVNKAVDDSVGHDVTTHQPSQAL